MGDPAKKKRLSPADQALADIEAEEAEERAKGKQDQIPVSKPEESWLSKVGEGVSDFGRMAATGFTSGFAPKIIADVAFLGTPDRERSVGRGMDSGVMSKGEERLLAERDQMAEEDAIRQRSPVVGTAGELAGAGLQAYLGLKGAGMAARAVPGLVQTGSRLANPIMRALGPGGSALARNATIGAIVGAPAGVGYGDPERPVSERLAEGGAGGAVFGGVLGQAGRAINPILGGIKRHGERAWQKMQSLNEPGGGQVRAFAEAGGQPASPLPEALGGERGTFRPTPAMRGAMERAERSPAGAGSFGELAYDEITPSVMQKLEGARAKTMADVTQVTEDLAARYPRPVSMEPLREHINAVLAKYHTTDPTPAAMAAASKKRGGIQGATPGDDYASLGPESDIAFSYAPTLRRVADSLLRKDPAEFEVLLGGSAAEQAAARTAVGRPRRQPSASRGGAAVDELADDAVELDAVAEADSASRRKVPPPVPEVVAKGPAQRYAQYDLRALIQLRQEIDSMSQFEGSRGSRGVEALRALGGKVREMITTMVSPDDLALIEQQSENISQMKARLGTFGVSGLDKIDLTKHGKDWRAVNAALKGDTQAMRDEGLAMDRLTGSDLMTDVTRARGTAAYEGLEKGTAGDETRALGSMALAASGSRLALPAAVRGALLRPRRAGLMHVNPIVAPPGIRVFTGAQGGRMAQKEKR